MGLSKSMSWEILLANSAQMSLWYLFLRSWSPCHSSGTIWQDCGCIPQLLVAGAAWAYNMWVCLSEPPISLSMNLFTVKKIRGLRYTDFQTQPPPTCLLPRSCFSCPSAPAMTELPSLKWLIFGCGGVGGYFGARIAQVKGQRVSYIAACLQKSDIQKSDLIRFP